MGKEYSTHEKIMLFDLENFKRKVKENPTKYDKRNNLIPLIEKARLERRDEIVLFRANLYLADVWVIHYMGCFNEFEHLGSGWNDHIFLSKEAHEKYLNRIEQNLIEDLMPFVEMGFF